MSSFTQRSYQKELLDAEGLPFEDIKRNMDELDIINQRLGGHRITIDGINEMLKNAKDQHDPFFIVEIGCGGGDNLYSIKNWAKKKEHTVRLTGVDINGECIDYARRQNKNTGIEFIHSDYRQAEFEQKPDIIFSSLFCHHFTDEELISMLQWMKQNSRLGFFINDLHRHPLAFYSIKFLTQVFSKSYLVKNDAPLSVKRGFTRSEWKKLFNKAGIPMFNCQWRWAFRWLIISFN